MKKKLTQVLGITMAVVLAAGLAACGNEDGAPGTGAGDAGANQESQEKAPAESTGNEEAESAGGEITYPLATDDTLTFWSKGQIKPSMAYSDYTESPFHTGLAERTGVDVEWLFPAEGADLTQAYNLMLTDDVLPDIIFSDMGPGDAQTLMKDGVIYDLTEYLPKYAPDYWAAINDPKYAAALKTATTSEGAIYSFRGLGADRFVQTYMGPVVRKDWLDECGLKEPVTMDDWEEVLIAFKEKYGATFGFFAARLNNNGIGSGTGAYATFDTGNAASFFVDDDGQVQLAQAQPEWKAYMEYLHRWWDMGLIDTDSLSMDDAAVRTKVLNNEIGISFTSLGQVTAWTQDAENEGTGANWIGISYPRTAPDAPTCMIQASYSLDIGWGAVVTTSCPEEKLITALEWLNYGYTEEGIMYWNFGEEGVSYYIDENGEPQWTDLILNDPDGTVEARTKYSGANGCAPLVGHINVVKNSFAPVAIDAVYSWMDNSNAWDHILPLISRTDEENAAFSDRMSAIQTYVEQMGTKFMTGDESLDNFDAYLEQLDSMGLQEVLEIQQAAYDRFRK